MISGTAETPRNVRTCAICFDFDKRTSRILAASVQPRDLTKHMVAAPVSAVSAAALNANMGVVKPVLDSFRRALTTSFNTYVSSTSHNTNQVIRTAPEPLAKPAQSAFRGQTQLSTFDQRRGRAQGAYMPRADLEGGELEPPVLLGPSLSAFSFCISTFGALTVLSIAGAVGNGLSSDQRFQCALSGASSGATGFLYWRLSNVRRQPLLQGYTEEANASVESHRYLGWVLNVGLLTMIGISLRGSALSSSVEVAYMQSYDELSAAAFGSVSMICSAAGWSTVGEAIRRLRSQQMRGTIALIGVGLLLVLSSAIATFSVQQKLHAVDSSTHLRVYGPFRHSLYGWVSRVSFAYPVFSFVSSVWSISSIALAPSKSDIYRHDENESGVCDSVASALACMLGVLCQSRRQTDGISYSQMALVDEMCLHQLEGKSVNLTWPRRSVLHRHQVLDTVSCIVDLVVVGGTAVACTVFAFSTQ
jgi:hypothetical protein